MVVMLKLLRLKWSQSYGLQVLAHGDIGQPFKLKRASGLLDASRFNFIGKEYGWPEVGGECWHDEVRRALIDLKVTDFADLTLYTKVGLAMIMLGLVRIILSLEDALTALERERALI